MLSNLVRAHPDVLSISEFFSLLYGPMFQEGLLDASQFWKLLSAASPYIPMVFHYGLAMPELLYPVSATSRHTLATGIPGILITTLPHLTDDYETVYDELQQTVSGFPPDRIEGHYARLFGWLKQRFGRKVCVERSGGSLVMVPAFVRLFPNAKFIHIVRDGRACALSMSRHHGFRLRAILMLQEEVLGVNPTVSNDRTKIDALSEDLQRLLPEHFNGDAYRNYDIPIEVFGKLWSQSIIAGVRSLLTLPEEQVMTISYEQFLAHPERHMKQIMTFIDPSLPTDSWISSASTVIQQKASPKVEGSALETACQPGQAILEVLEKEGFHSARLRDLLQTS
jgi:putative sulfotransferase